MPKILRHRKTTIFYEEGPEKIWLLWVETPQRFRSQGRAKAALDRLREKGKPLIPGTFSKAAEGLKKYFHPTEKIPQKTQKTHDNAIH
jgi:hypothetical protein